MIRMWINWRWEDEEEKNSSLCQIRTDFCFCILELELKVNHIIITFDSMTHSDDYNLSLWFFVVRKLYLVGILSLIFVFPFTKSFAYFLNLRWIIIIVDYLLPVIVINNKYIEFLWSWIMTHKGSTHRDLKIRTQFIYRMYIHICDILVTKPPPMNLHLKV